MFIEPQPEFLRYEEEFFTIRTEQRIFVDKSNFIKEIIDSNEKGIVLTRPNNWGKTFNMRMLECFFRIELDEEKKPIDKKKRKPLFEGGEY